MTSKKGKIYNKWTYHEDICLKQLVEMQEGKLNWNKLSFQMSSMQDISKRSGKQCRERWISYLNSQQNKQPWSPEDDKNLFQQQKKFGTKWCQIAKYFPGRTDSSIKNRFYSKIRKALRKMCRYLNLRAATISIYKIKPNTITQIFKKGQADYPCDSKDQQYQLPFNSYKQIINNDANENLIQFSKKKVAWTINKILQIHDIQEDLLNKAYYQKILEEQDSCNHIEIKRRKSKQNRKKIINKKNKIQQDRKIIQLVLQKIEQDYGYERKDQIVKNEDNMKMEEYDGGNQLINKYINTNVKIQQDYMAQIAIKTQALEDPYIYNFGGAAIKQQTQLAIRKIEQREIIFQAIPLPAQGGFQNTLLCKIEER